MQVAYLAITQGEVLKLAFGISRIRWVRLSVQLFLDVFSLGLSSHFASYSISLFYVGFVLFHCRQFLCRIGDMAANSPKHTTSDLLREKRNITQHLPLQNMPWKAILGPV